MNMQKYNIEKLPFFQSFTSGAKTKAVIDVQAFNVWLEQVQHIDFLSDVEETERVDAYKEFESGQALDLKEAMKEW